MAGSYVLPQVRVFQEFAETPNDVTQNLNPFIIGPNYQLMRYAEKDERSDCRNGTYTGSALSLNWSDKAITGSSVDTTWYGVTFENAYVQLGEGNGTCLDTSGPTGSQVGTKFEFNLAGASLTEEGSTTLAFGTPIKAGDYLSYMSGTTRKYTKIRAISCGTVESGSITSTIKDSSTGADSNIVVDTTGYIGEKNVTVRIKVVDESSTKKITWSSNVAGITSGTAAATELTTSGVDLGKGLVVKAPASGTVAAANYTLKVTIREPFSRDTVTVADLTPATTGTFQFVRRLDAVTVDAEFLDVSDTGVSVAAGVTVTLPELGTTARTVLQATAYLTQRNLVKSYADGVYSLRTDTEIINNLGAITPDNPLAYGAHVMLQNCATASIKYTAVESDDRTGFIKALDRASMTTEVYAFCPLTEDRTIIDDVVSECNRLSTPEEKSWRISFFSAPTEGERDVTPNVDGVYEKCKVVSKLLTCYNGSTTTQSVVSDFTNTVQAGDVVTVTDTNGISHETTVAKVESSTTLTLTDDVADASTSNCRFTIVHKLGVAEYVTAIATTSESFKDRRAYNVFPNKLRNTDGTYVSGMYGAAAVCALACSVSPQQPITNVEIKGFSDIPDVYSKYNRDQLNEIAAGGTLILMQDKIGGSIYVRHQISTAYSDGNLNTTELSLTKNLDSISYYFANRFAPYIGRYNVTDDLLTELKGILTDGLAHLETATETNRLVGPQVLADGTEIRSIYRDPTEKDKVYADVALNLPAPFNNFDLRLQVI